MENIAGPLFRAPTSPSLLGKLPDLQRTPFDMAVLALEAEMALGGLDRIAGGDDDIVERDLGAGADNLDADLLPLLRILDGGFERVRLAIESRRREPVAEEHAM